MNAPDNSGGGGPLGTRDLSAIALHTGRAHRPVRGALQSLTVQDLDRRIERLTRDVAAPGIAGGLDQARRTPRWISAAQLVERMRPYLVYN